MGTKKLLIITIVIIGIIIYLCSNNADPIETEAVSIETIENKADPIETQRAELKRKNLYIWDNDFVPFDRNSEELIRSNPVGAASIIYTLQTDGSLRLNEKQVKWCNSLFFWYPECSFSTYKLILGMLSGVAAGRYSKTELYKFTDDMIMSDKYTCNTILKNTNITITRDEFAKIKNLFCNINKPGEQVAAPAPAAAPAPVAAPAQVEVHAQNDVFPVNNSDGQHESEKTTAKRYGVQYIRSITYKGKSTPSWIILKDRKGRYCAIITSSKYPVLESEHYCIPFSGNDKDLKDSFAGNIVAEIDFPEHRKCKNVEFISQNDYCNRFNKAFEDMARREEFFSVSEICKNDPDVDSEFWDNICQHLTLENEDFL